MKVQGGWHGGVRARARCCGVARGAAGRADPAIIVSTTIDRSAMAYDRCAHTHEHDAAAGLAEPQQH
jgi:hypothetical protein